MGLTGSDQDVSMQGVTLLIESMLFTTIIFTLLFMRLGAREHENLQSLEYILSV